LSATTGKGKEPADFYPTPDWAIRVLAKQEKLNCDSFLEPACGDGRIFNYVYSAHSAGTDIREDLIVKARMQFPIYNLLLHDFLTLNFGETKYDLIMTNPPFSLAKEFVNKSLSLLTGNGRCIMLLRINFMATKDRLEFNRSHMPARIYLLAERPKFVRNGNDNADYAWIVWQEGWDAPTTFSILSKTDLVKNRRIEDFQK
jgi:hypothetical protein